MGDPFERVKGIEPSPPAWKAGALPLSYTRESLIVNDWSGWSDLNRRPPAPKAGTLPSCATARIVRQGNCSSSLSVVLFSVPPIRYLESMELENTILKRVQGWDNLSRWEKSELGRDLRRAGLSYGEIMARIEVKKSTLANWCRDVRLSAGQFKAIKSRRAHVPGIPRDTNWRRRVEIANLRAAAKFQVPRLAMDPFWVAGLVLYWAEGAKSRNHLSMANTDPRALRLFVLWSRTYLRTEAEFSIQLHLHEGNNEAEAISHWQLETGLSEANFHKTFIKAAGTGHRKNHLPHGICTVKMRRASDPWNVVLEWIDAYSSHLGLDHRTG